VETRKKYSTKELTKFTLHLNCVSTLPGKTKTTYEQQIFKSIITVRSIESVVHNFSRKSSNVFNSSISRKLFYLSSVIKTFTFLRVFEFFRPIFKLKYSVFHFEKSLYEVNFCDVQCDTVMTSSSQ